MPAKRLPWYKVWAEHVDHPKVVELSDGQYRTWQYLLTRASQQANRWTFASDRHAAAVSGRPLAHVRSLVALGFLDEGPNGLTIHNWKKWQDKYPSDYSLKTAAKTAGTVPESSREHSVNAAGKLPPTLPESLTRDRDQERPPYVGLEEKDQETETEHTRSGDQGDTGRELWDAGLCVPPSGESKDLASPKTSREAVFATWWDEIHPSRNGILSGKSEAGKLFRLHVPPGDEDAFLAAARVYAASEEATKQNGKYARLPANWLPNWRDFIPATAIDQNDIDALNQRIRQMAGARA